MPAFCVATARLGVPRAPLTRSASSGALSAATYLQGQGVPLASKACEHELSMVQYRFGRGMSRAERSKGEHK